MGCTPQLVWVSLIKLMFLKEFNMKYPELNLYSNIFELKDEVWRDILTYEKSYQVSNFGRIRTKTRKVSRMIRGMCQQVTKKALVKLIHNDSKGYPTVQLSKDGKKITQRVHRLVAEHFLPKPTLKLVEACKHHGEVYVNHKDGDKNNPNVNNIEWCNQTYNCEVAVTSVIINKLSGENSTHAKLNAVTVLKIVEDYNSGGVSQQQLADKYGVKQITISNILTGYSWSTVTGIPKKQRKFKHRQQPMKD